AEPLARGTPELELFSERLCRTYCATGHANRPVAPRKRRLGHYGGLVHFGLRRRRDIPARLERLSGGGSRVSVVWRLRGAAPLFCPAAPHPLAAYVRYSVGPHRPRRR